MNWLLAPLAFLLGFLLTTQLATNKKLGEALDNLYVPALVNMLIGAVATFVITLFATDQLPSRDLVRAAPWYAWFAGGLLGATYLTGTILLAPKLGAAAVVGLVVAGQLIFSVILDHFGWIGFEQHSAGAPRLFGCILMLIGVFLISRY
jgi:transporter family-2 protein